MRILTKKERTRTLNVKIKTDIQLSLLQTLVVIHRFYPRWVLELPRCVWRTSERSLLRHMSRAMVGQGCENGDGFSFYYTRISVGPLSSKFFCQDQNVFRQEHFRRIYQSQFQAFLVDLFGSFWRTKGVDHAEALDGISQPRQGPTRVDIDGRLGVIPPHFLLQIGNVLATASRVSLLVSPFHFALQPDVPIHAPQCVNGVVHQGHTMILPPRNECGWKLH